jgi:hypothetical protein
MEIEKGKIPAPKKRGRKAKYPVRDLVEVGMNFFVPGKTALSHGHALASYWNDYKQWPPGNAPRFKAYDDEKDGVKGYRLWRVE